MQTITLYRPTGPEFQMEAEYLSRYPVQVAGGREHSEYWIPAEELEKFNSHIIGNIKVIKSFM